jgi:hypothetical protein
MRLLVVLKFILVFGLFVAGVLFSLKGLGVAAPLVTYKGAEAHDLPAGIVLIVLGIALARFWKIRSSHVVITETSTNQKDGQTQTTKTETRSDIRFMPRTK